LWAGQQARQALSVILRASKPNSDAYPQETKMAASVTRALNAIKRYATGPEQIDHAILSAINVTLCLASNGNNRVAEGFNGDIAGSGRDFRGVQRLAFC
jgi:hypothetical protein